MNDIETVLWKPSPAHEGPNRWEVVGIHTFTESCGGRFGKTGFIGQGIDIEQQWLIFSIMVKTQVQLPDHIYKETKRIAAQYEMSMAEVVRRGLERVIPCYPDRDEPDGGWALPVLDLGLRLDPFANPDWREQASAHLEEDQG